MKTKKIFLVALITFSAIATLQLNVKKNSKMSFMFANVEALANNENEAEAKKFDCYSIFEGEGKCISCSTCEETNGTPPWYHFGSTCYKK